MKSVQLAQSKNRTIHPAIAAMTTPVSDPANVRQVDFVVEAPRAQDVYLAGTFNGWDPRRTPMKKRKDGKWHTAIRLGTGRHEYRFVVDGQWASDPKAKESVENPFGGDNSVLVIES